MPESIETQEIDLEFLHGMQNYIEIHQEEASKALAADLTPTEAGPPDDLGYMARYLIQAAQHASKAQGCAYVLKQVFTGEAKRKAGEDWKAAEQIHVEVHRRLHELWTLKA